MVSLLKPAYTKSNSLVIKKTLIKIIEFKVFNLNQTITYNLYIIYTGNYYSDLFLFEEIYW